MTNSLVATKGFFTDLPMVALSDGVDVCTWPQPNARSKAGS
jgi:hypothetical protein